MNRRWDWIDLLVGGTILALGAWQFTWFRSADVVFDDTYYCELARSLLLQGYYGFDFRYETLLPPGFPLILALVSAAFGSAGIVYAAPVTISMTLGLLASYALLRREMARILAAAICLLLASAPRLFMLSIGILSDLPYFLVSIICLVVAANLDAADRPRDRIIWASLFAISMVSALMIRTAGIALLGAFVAWIGVSFPMSRARAAERLKRFLPGLVLGGLAVGAWMWWGKTHYRAEWPIPGWPGSYLSQLMLKNGNYPEMGRASLADIPGRVEGNLLSEAESLDCLLLHKGWKHEWYSPVVTGTILLVLLGLVSSLRRGGGYWEWYFIAYQAMFLFWPWNFETRFVVPIAPLGCLYLCRGVERLFRGGAALRVAAAGLAVIGAPVLSLAAWRHHVAYYSAFWAVVAISAVMLAGWTLIRSKVLAQATAARWNPIVASSWRNWRVLQLGFAAAVLVLFATGVVGQHAVARENLQPDPARQALYPNVEAARWIEAHTGPSDVVMARNLDLVYHYSHRRVIWFPPCSDPEILIEGVRKYAVNWVVVTTREDTYFFPDDHDCFEALQRKYPERFRLAYETPHFRIFFVPNGPAAAPDPPTKANSQ